MYYDQDYFKWQRKIGEFSASINKHRYAKYIKPTDNVIDFGSGGGFLLKNLVCKNKIGIEINPVALKYANENGIKTVDNAEEISDNWADVIISSHVLEHTLNPLEEIRKLKLKLKKGGTIIFVTPYERTNKYKENDINQHLFTWSPMNLGNLFTVAEYTVIECKELYHRFPPYPNFFHFFGSYAFNIICILTAFVRRDLSQVMLVAKNV